LKAIKDINELISLKGKTFTFGSESSTSGRLMPQHFLKQGGVTLNDLKGEAGFSGSHDKTVDLVEAGTYEVGAVNEQVWKRRIAQKKVDLSKVYQIWQTPAYHDYHWVINLDTEKRFGAEFSTKVQQAFLNLKQENSKHAKILNKFGAAKFIKTQDANYAGIEAVARAIGKIK